MLVPFKGHGKVVYDPFRAQMKAKTNWWAVIEVNKEITRYYRWWLERRYHLRLDAPAWDAHISLFRGEKPRPELMDLWKKHQGRQIQFQYGPELYKSESADGRHFWLLDVVCPEYIEMRKEMKRPTDFPPHITIGRERV